MERKDNVFDILCFVISKKGKNATEMQKKMLCSVYGEGSMTDWIRQKWFARFHAGDLSLDYKSK